MPLSHDDRVHCPHCHGTMRPGFVSVSHGLTWVHSDAGHPGDFRETLPGTASLMRANRLPAWRCSACSMVLLRYGRGAQRSRDFRDENWLAEHALATEMADEKAAIQAAAESD